MRTFVIELPGGETAQILRTFREKAISLSASIDWKGKDSFEFTIEDSGSTSLLEDLLLRIKLIAPDATIKERKHDKETTVEQLPVGRWIERTISCPNKNCVSAQPKEPSRPKFKIVSWSPVTLQCYYCGRYIDHGQIIAQLA